ncbi:MAG: hypothetical protein DWP97_13190 [Calditrichaeota bacterium]|nr:MAG: hypothetical protein DWP97_13190 [Calditrichota bacterium]
MKSTLLRIIIIVGILLGISNCSSIKTTKLVIGKDVKEIILWDLDFIPVSIPENIYNKILPDINTLSISNDFFFQFVNTTKSKLSTKKNIHFSNNGIYDGRIILDIYPTNELKFPNTKYNIKEYAQKDGQGKPDVLIEPTVLIDKEAPVGIIDSKIKIHYVKIYFLNNKKQLVGEIHLSGENIKPKDVANKIAEHI